VTEKEIELVPLCISVRVFGSLLLPVSAEIKFSGVTETVAAAVPYMMGAPAVMCATVSMLMKILKIGLVLIHTLIVTVIREPEGIVLKPLI